ncbi:VCBS repeat-containing protein [Streptomyces sp. NPDC002054]|uniref:FG-GAP repeat domain-containing protein n=1 Tax=Streptomyces sp. NPDC002054 TaxID=3154663 RepID=UPI0033333F80
MSSSRYQRLGRLAACTALAVAAGSLLAATPAAATGNPGSPAPTANAPRPGVSAAELRKATAAAKGQAAPAKSALVGSGGKPRLDIDGDGQSDWVYRTIFGYSESSLSAASYDFWQDRIQSHKDIVTLGNVRGGRQPELLQLTADGRLSLHTAEARGTSAPLWTGTGWQIYNRVIGAGDLTKDGRADLLARTPGGDLYLYKGTGAQSGNPFSDRVKVGGGWQIYDQIVGTNDLDADGVSDLVAKQPDGKLYFYKGTGSAAAPFKSRALIGGGWNTYNKIVAIDDVDGDGRAEMLGITHSGDMYLYVGKGAGTFHPRYMLSKGWQHFDLMVGQGITPVHGKNGVSGVDASNTVYTHLTQYDGRFVANRYVNDGWGQFPATGRLVNAAGMAPGFWGSHKLSLNGNVLTNLTLGQNVSGDYTNTDLVVGPGDLTGDGKGDLLTRDIWGNLYLKAGWNNGVDFWAPTWVGPYWNTYKAIVGAGDINGDGRTDIIGHDWNGNLYIHPGTGNAKAPFGERQWIGGGWNGYSAIAAPGDINGDGRADLVARDGNGNLYGYTATGWGGTHTFNSRHWIDANWNIYKSFN